MNNFIYIFSGTIFAAGRLCYVASREGHLCDILSFVHKVNLTPAPALVFNAVIAFVMILGGDIDSLIDFFSFTVWIFYGMSMLAVIVLRKTSPDLARPYKVPIFIPFIILIMSVWLVIAPIVDNPKVEYMYSIIFMVVGALIYVPTVMYKLKMPMLAKMTQCLQLVMKVIPPTSMPDC